LEAELSKGRYSEDQFDVAFKTVFTYLANPLKAWESSDYKEKRLMLGMYFERGKFLITEIQDLEPLIYRLL